MKHEELADRQSHDGGEGSGSETVVENASAEERRFTQAEVNALIERRLQREREKLEQAAQRERDEQAARKLEEQQQFQQLAEQLKRQLEAIHNESEQLRASLETEQSRATRYAEALAAQVAAQRKALPEHLHSLLDRLDPLEQLQWLTDNADKLRPSAVPPQTPKPDRQAAAAANQDEARKSQARLYRNF